jgi:hypothetical protein
MRTNIILNDKLVSDCLEASGIKTKKDLIEQALNLFLQVKKQGRIKNYRGKLPWTGDLSKERTEK